MLLRRIMTTPLESLRPMPSPTELMQVLPEKLEMAIKKYGVPSGALDCFLEDFVEINSSELAGENV